MTDACNFITAENRQRKWLLSAPPTPGNSCQVAQGTASPCLAGHGITAALWKGAYLGSLRWARIKQKEERDRKEKIQDGGRKGQTKKRQHPSLAHQRTVEDLGEVSGSSGSFPHSALSRSKHTEDHDLSSQNTQSRGGWSWDPRRLWHCKYCILSPSRQQYIIWSFHSLEPSSHRLPANGCGWQECIH